MPTLPYNPQVSKKMLQSLEGIYRNGKTETRYKFWLPMIVLDAKK